MIFKEELKETKINKIKLFEQFFKVKLNWELSRFDHFVFENEIKEFHIGINSTRFFYKENGKHIQLDWYEFGMISHLGSDVLWRED